MTCPRCRGQKELRGIGCSPVGCRPIVLPCQTCNGTGEIAEERGRWISEGRRLHRYRLGHSPDYCSMLAAAVKHGVTLGQWADAEAGRADPTPLIARVKRNDSR